MTRVVSVGRSFNGLWAARALGLAFLTISWAGCAGSLDPSAFPTGGGGATGAAGTGAAGTGAAGTTGMAGTTGGGCDVTPLVAKYMCANGGCHDAPGTSANFVMVGNWTSMLVGVKPKGGGTLPSACMASTTPYIINKSATGDGLFLQKLKASPSCGAQMPFGMAAMSAADLMCFQQFTTALANQ